MGQGTYIPDNVVTALTQDKLGFVWIGTPSGIIRYDGYQFKNYSHNTSMDKNIAGMFVTDILQQDDGDLWIATDPGGLSYYQKAADRFTSIQLDNPDDQHHLLESARVLTLDQGNHIWFGGRDGLFRLDKTFRNITYSNQRASQIELSQVRALLPVKHWLFIGAKEGLFVIDTKTFALRKIQINFTYPGRPTQVLSLHNNNNEDIWIGTASQGLYRLNLESWQARRIASSFTDSTTVDEESPINDILQVDDNTLWLARFDGIDAVNISTAKWQGKVTSEHPSEFSLPHSDVRALMQDSAGQIWTGGYGSGVKLYQGQAAISVLSSASKKPFTLPTNSISSILEHSNGQLWLGSRGEGIIIVQRDKGVVRHITPVPRAKNQLRSGWVTTMVERTPDEVWLGVNPAQLYRYSLKNDHFSLIDNTKNFWQANIRRLFVDSKQRLWIGTNEGIGLWDDNTQSILRITEQNHSPFTDYVNGFIEDNNNNIWVATGANGLMQLQPDRLQVLPAEYSPNTITSHGAVLGLLLDSKNRLWFDTPSGLYFINDLSAPKLELTKINAINDKNNSDFGANLLEDLKGRIWSQRKIFDPENKTIYALTPSDGVYHGTNWYRSYAKTRDGLMLFGGSEGILVIEPERFKQWDYQPRVQLTQAALDDRIVQPIDGKIYVPSDVKSISLEFSGLDLSSPQSLQYRHRLVGFDKSWRYTDATHRRLSYTNLWPGNYQLNIQTTNRAGQWSPHSLTLQLNVVPAFWQTYWFFLLIFILLILTVTAIVKFRTRRLKLLSKALEQQVEIRTKELQAAQIALSEKEKMAALGHLVAGVAHEINTPLGISITAASLQLESANKISQQFAEKKLTSQRLQHFLQLTEENLTLLMANLQRSADLVQTFKEVAIDKSMTETETIEANSWLKERIKLLGHKLNVVDVIVTCPTSLYLELPTKALETVLLHLINNSLVHGFLDKTANAIHISLEYQNGQCQLVYRDNGVGFDPSVKNKLFEPFVTTRRGTDCKGLGLHLCFNLINQALGGTIQLLDDEGAGFMITFPANLITR